MTVISESGTIAANGTYYLKSSVLKGPRAGGTFNTLVVYGTWGNGTLSIKINGRDGGTYVALDDTLSADGFINFQAKWHSLALVLAGATNPSLTFDLL